MSVSTVTKRDDVTRALMNLFNNLSPVSAPTALHLAAQSGSSECVRALLAGGADPNLVDNLQQTPLFSAVEGGHSKCIEAVRHFLDICKATKLLLCV